MQQQDSSQKTIIIATISFIVGFGLAWLISVNKDSVRGVSQTEKEAGGSALVHNVISVNDQPEGVRVALNAVSFEESGWAVIHEDDTGKPGRILGAQLFDKGTTTPGTVDLLRGTLAGNTYYAMLHHDNGDHAFDPKKDEPIVGDDGLPVMMKFQATVATDTQ